MISWLNCTVWIWCQLCCALVFWLLPYLREAGRYRHLITNRGGRGGWVKVDAHVLNIDNWPWVENVPTSGDLQSEVSRMLGGVQAGWFGDQLFLQCAVRHWPLVILLNQNMISWHLVCHFVVVCVSLVWLLAAVILRMRVVTLWPSLSASALRFRWRSWLTFMYRELSPWYVFCGWVNMNNALRKASIAFMLSWFHGPYPINPSVLLLRIWLKSLNLRSTRWFVGVNRLLAGAIYVFVDDGLFQRVHPLTLFLLLISWQWISVRLINFDALMYCFFGMRGQALLRNLGRFGQGRRDLLRSEYLWGVVLFLEVLQVDSIVVQLFLGARQLLGMCLGLWIFWQVFKNYSVLALWLLLLLWCLVAGSVIILQQTLVALLFSEVARVLSIVQFWFASAFFSLAVA